MGTDRVLARAVLALADVPDRPAAAPRVGTKAWTLAVLARRGLPVPPGLVVPAGTFSAAGTVPAPAAEDLLRWCRERGGGRFAVRSSAVAEDRDGASFAGLYTSVLDVPAEEVTEAVARCLRSAHSPRVIAYTSGAAPGAAVAGAPGAATGAATGVGPGSSAGMAVLVQVMVDAAAAGVAFTANPLTGDPGEAIVSAVTGLGQALVSGAVDAEEWAVRGRRATRTRRATVGDVLTPAQARAVARLAEQARTALGAAGAGPAGSGPLDVEWALDRAGRMWLVQARPMTAVPTPVDWTPPSPGHWMRTFRLGEWLPEPVTPLFADWLLPRLEAGYLAGMRDTAGVAVPFRYAVVHGWYYTAPPQLSLRLLARILATGRARVIRLVVNALIRAGRDPVAADRAVLAELAGQWRRTLLPTYRRAVADAGGRVETAGPEELVALVDELADLAGRYLWSLAVVGGSAWKMEAALARFCHRHLSAALAGEPPQRLLAALPGIDAGTPAHAVHSVDWFHPTAGEATPTPGPPGRDPARQVQVAAQQARLEDASTTALTWRPRRARRFAGLLAVSRRYALLREQQARDLTLAWPAMRRAVIRLGELAAAARPDLSPEDAFFLTLPELAAARTATGPGAPDDLAGTAARRRQEWERQRSLLAPLTLGGGQRLAERAVAAAVTAARAGRPEPTGLVVGHPASPGRASGPVRIVDGPAGFAAFADGEVLVARATAPAWTPLFGRAAAVVTDAGTLAAHASLIAREYGIPAVVGTADATRRLRDGQLVTVDGGAGTVVPASAAWVGPGGRRTEP